MGLGVVSEVHFLDGKIDDERRSRVRLEGELVCRLIPRRQYGAACEEGPDVGMRRRGRVVRSDLRVGVRLGLGERPGDVGGDVVYLRLVAGEQETCEDR